MEWPRMYGRHSVKETSPCCSRNLNHQEKGQALLLRHHNKVFYSTREAFSSSQSLSQGTFQCFPNISFLCSSDNVQAIVSFVLIGL